MPVTVLTLGLFLLVVNGLVPGIAVTNLGWAILAAIVIAIVNAALGSLLG